MHLRLKQTMKYAIILALFFFIQCSNNKEVSSSTDFSSYDLHADYDNEIEPPRTIKTSKPESDLNIDEVNKVIKQGNIKFEVIDLNKTKKHIDKTLKELGAYYESENFLAYENGNHYSLKIRIPNSRFDTLISILESGNNELISKNISVKDVTEEFIDINIRLKNKLAYLEQYKQILKKAKTISEILSVQERIRLIEAEIESKKGKLKFLEDKVNYSTLNVELTEFNRSNNTESKFLNKISQALGNGAKLLQTIIIFFISIWPLLLLLLFILIFRKRLLNIKRRK